MANLVSDVAGRGAPSLQVHACMLQAGVCHRDFVDCTDFQQILALSLTNPGKP